MRRVLVLALLPFALAGCGGDGEQQRPDTDQACPQGTPSLQARDIIGSTPKGYIVDRGDQQAIGEIAGRISDSIGTTLRDHDGRVLARRGASSGTLVLVVNATKRAPDSDQLIGSMTANEEKLGLSGENITVGRVEGRLSRAVDGSYVATAPAGTCAIVMLIDEREQRLRDAALLVINEGP
jgi:hypothetical protein